MVITWAETPLQPLFLIPDPFAKRTGLLYALCPQFALTLWQLIQTMVSMCLYTIEYGLLKLFPPLSCQLHLTILDVAYKVGLAGCCDMTIAR